MNKLTHLELIQAIVIRMAGNSFLLKGWSVILVSALFALAAADTNPAFVFVAFVPVVSFWFLDAYFLRQERLFRKLYDEVRAKQEAEIDFSMSTAPFKDAVPSWIETAASSTLILFYAAVLVALILVSGAVSIISP